MIVGIMQPYFFPYSGYFSLIKHTDRFILSDSVQYINRGWIARNRILKHGKGWQYIVVPLQKFHHTTAIKDVLIDNSKNWKEQILAQLYHYKKIAPNYRLVTELLKDIFSNDHPDIVSLNQASLSKTCEYLGFVKKIEVFSQMNLDLLPVNAPDEWSLNTCLAIEGAREYWNLPGGQSFYDKQKYENANVIIKFQIPQTVVYNQKRDIFEDKLSILDVMMFNSVTDVNAILDNYLLE